MRRYVSFTAVSLALFLAAVNATALTVAFPVMIKELATPLVVAGWIFTAFQATQVAVMPTAGRIAELIGRRNAFIIFASVFTLGSLLCALSPGVYFLIAARVVQAFGSAGLLPCAADIIASLFPKNRQRAVGFISTVFPIGEIIGPGLGAWLVSSWGWRATFWFSFFLGVLIVTGVWLLLRPATDKATQPQTRKKLDAAGAVLLAGVLVMLMLSITQVAGAIASSTWTWVLLSLAVCGALITAFVIHERRTGDSIVDFTLLRKKPFLAANVYSLIYGACGFGVFSLVPLYAASVYGASVTETGIILTPRYVGMMAAATVTSFLLVRHGYRRPLILGVSLMVLCLTSLGLELDPSCPLGIAAGIPLLLGTILGISGIGSGVSGPAANNACIELMPDRIATITGLRGMFRVLGSAMAIAVTTLTIQVIADPHLAFRIAFFGWAGVLLLSIPAILAMPAGPKDTKH